MKSARLVAHLKSIADPEAVARYAAGESGREAARAQLGGHHHPGDHGLTVTTVQVGQVTLSIAITRDPDGLLSTHLLPFRRYENEAALLDAVLRTYVPDASEKEF